MEGMAVVISHVSSHPSVVTVKAPQTLHKVHSTKIDLLGSSNTRSHLLRGTLPPLNRVVKATRLQTSPPRSLNTSQTYSLACNQSPLCPLRHILLSQPTIAGMARSKPSSALSYRLSGRRHQTATRIRRSLLPVIPLSARRSWVATARCLPPTVSPRGVGARATLRTRISNMMHPMDITILSRVHMHSKARQGTGKTKGRYSS